MACIQSAVRRAKRMRTTPASAPAIAAVIYGHLFIMPKSARV